MSIFSLIKSSTVNVCKALKLLGRSVAVTPEKELHQSVKCRALWTAMPDQVTIPSQATDRAWDTGCSLDAQTELSTIIPSLSLVHSHTADNHKSKREDSKTEKERGGREGED